MYGYINGIVKEIESNYIILENNNIGYIIYVANPYSYIIDNEYKIYLYQQIREEHNLRVSSKVREAKEDKLGFAEPIERPRRRRANQYYNEYVVAGNTALKR